MSIYGFYKYEIITIYGFILSNDPHAKSGT